MLRSKLLSSLAAVTLVAAGAIVADSNVPAAAAISQCASKAVNEQVGWGTAFYPHAQPAGGIEGSSSYIYTEPVALCSTDHNGGVNFSTSWNMVYGTSGGYAQSGLMYRYGYGCIEAWAEQNDHGTFADWNYGCVAQGSRHAYRNLAVYTGGSWHVQSTVDGHNIRTSTWSPFAEWNSPFQISFTAETYYPQSDAMGTPSKKTAYTAMGVQRYDTNALVGTCGHASLSPYKYSGAYRYATDSLDCNYVRTWTK